MKIQKISCNYNYNTNPVYANKSYQPKLNNQTDTFTPSFGVKLRKEPLPIPADMFKTVEEATEFSKLVEALRTISTKNYLEPKYKDAAKKLLSKKDFFNTYAQVEDFIRKYDSNAKLKTEDEFLDWSMGQMALLEAAKKGKKEVSLSALDEFFSCKNPNNFDEFPASGFEDDLF